MIEWAVVVGAVFVLVIVVVAFLGPHIDRKIILSKVISAAAIGASSAGISGPFGANLTQAPFRDLTAAESAQITGACAARVPTATIAATASATSFGTLSLPLNTPIAGSAITICSA